MSDYYISDTHFGHANIIRFCNRPFESVEEMDEEMIRRWNERVAADDHVWHLGDFGYRSGRSARNYLDRLHGHIHLIIGNHDTKNVLKQVSVRERFETVEYAVMRTDGAGRKLWLCHYPLATAPRGVFCLYGHIHNNTQWSYWDLLKTYDMHLNCCVELNGYRPVTFEELVANNERWRAEHFDDRTETGRMLKNRGVPIE